MHVFLETERLVLRRFTPDDVDLLVELDSDPEVMRFITGGVPTPRAEIESDILPHFLRYYERFAGLGFWAAVERASGAFVGWFHFRPPADAGPGDVELGYRLRRAAWGSGYATEGARALIHKGFTELGVRRVVASLYEENVASRRVLEKAGMRLVRRYRPTAAELAAHGLPADTSLWEGEDLEYALERAEWERQQASSPPPAGG
jgi:RimJ/RimL family protein N-acetyltransferase